MFCGQCGKELADGTKFCGYCGAAQEGGNSPVVKVQKTAGQPEDVAESGPAPDNGKMQRQTRKKAKKGKGGLIAVLAVLILLIAAGAGTALYFTGDSYNIAKDLKLAGECFEEGEYREALSYYKDALRRDSALTEAYLGSAEVYLAQQDMEKAKEELKKGLKKVRGDEEAQTVLTAKLAEIYLQEVNLYANRGEFAMAYSLLQEGMEETGAVVLTASKVDIYLKEADSYIINGDNPGAMQVLRQGLEETESAARQQELRQKEAEIYRMESDALLADGDCLAALAILTEGMQETEVSILAEREAYLRENIICVRETGADYQTEYDTAGNTVRETGRTGSGLRYEYKCEYDAAGRLIAEEYNEPDGYRAEIRYNENGRPISGDMSGRSQGSFINGTLEYDGASDSAKWTIAERDSDYILCREFIWVGTGDMTLAKEYDNQGYGLFYEYDAAGNPVKKTYSDSADNVNIHEYGYDATGNQIQDKYYDNVGYGYEKTMAYDASGNILEYTLTENDGNTEYRSYENEYDMMSNLIRCTEHNRDGSVTGSDEWQYEYLYVGE